MSTSRREMVVVVHKEVVVVVAVVQVDYEAKDDVAARTSDVTYQNMQVRCH